MIVSENSLNNLQQHNENLRHDYDFGGPLDTPERKARRRKVIDRGNRLRKFWKDEFLQMDEQQMKDYIDNPKNPYVNRVYAKMFLAEPSIDSLYKLADQTEGKPKEDITISGLPPITLDCFEGNIDEDK